MVTVVRPLVSNAIKCFKGLYLMCVTKSSVTCLFLLTNTIIFCLNILLAYFLTHVH